MRKTNMGNNKKGSNRRKAVAAAAFILSGAVCAGSAFALSDTYSSGKKGGRTEVTEVEQESAEETEGLPAEAFTEDGSEFPGSFPGGQGQMQGGQGQMPGGRGQMGGQGQMQDGQNGFQGGFPGAAFSGEESFSSEPSEIVESDVENSAAELTADEENAVVIEMSDENNEVTIKEAGTYIVTGSCSNGSIKVKKETKGVVLILKDLDLTSTDSATLSVNKGSEVKIIIEGEVVLTDAENPDDENSEDAEVADAFDGAAIKVKAGANAVLTGSGTLTLDGSACKNGIKVSDPDEEYGTAAFTIDGDLTVNIDAANDAVNSGYDLVILSGTLNIKAGDDALHADRILQIGSSEDAEGPVISITSSNEGMEGTVVNIFGGEVTVNSSDDAVNAANKNQTYSSELAYSVNITGGTVTINAGTDGIDSNGNINITGGYTTIDSKGFGGDAGIDYIGSCYVEEGSLENHSGVSMDSGSGHQGGRGWQ